MADTAPAAPAAPVAPVAPAPAPAAAAPVAPAAPAAPVAPAPVAAAAPAPVAPATPAPTPAAQESLLDGAAPPAPAAGVPPTLEEAQRIVEAAKLAAQPNSGLAWNLNDTTPGVGEKPAWFKGDKYKNVAEQAKAYNELESRMGAFVGAPKDGNYTVTVPDTVGTFDMKHPMMVGFKEWAIKNQVSNDKFNDLLGQLAQYEQVQAPNMAQTKASLGPDANARISNVVTWARANLDKAGFENLREATSGKAAAATFKVIEQLIKNSGQVRMPKPGEDVPQGGTGGLAEIDKMQAAKNEKGQRLYEIDPAYRRTVEQKRTEYFAANPVARDRQGNRRG